MPSQLPPNVIIFPGIDYNPSFYSSKTDALTYEEAVKEFLTYPNAQGTENLKTVNINGVSTFNDNILVATNKNLTMSGTGSITQNSTNTSTNNTLGITNIDN
jgi:hypothetical protein